MIRIHEPISARAQGHGGPPHGPGDGALRQRGPLPACRRRVGGGAPGGGGGQRPAGAHDAARPPAQVRLEDHTLKRVHASAHTREREHTYTRTGDATRSRASRAPILVIRSPRSGAAHYEVDTSARAAAPAAMTPAQPPARRSVIHDLEHLLETESVEVVRWAWPGEPDSPSEFASGSKRNASDRFPARAVRAQS